MTHSGSRGDGTYQTYTFDSANRRKVFYSHQKVTSGRFQYGTYTVNRTNEYDGDGHPLKTTEVTMNIPEWQNEATLVKYQLWSSVFGGYITALKDDGAKETTKVYAGGAVIAEQTTRYGNEVYWIHADPVTGSSTRTTKTGAEYTRKEYEPFGQEVAVIEPEEEFPAPEGNADNLVDANDPHWQCQMADAIGTDFNNRPVHCQRSAQLAGISNADMYAEILGHQEAQRKRRHNMPANAAATNKPPADTNGSNANKPQEEASGSNANAYGEGAGGVPAASIPDDDGDTEGNVVLGLPTGQPGGASVTVFDNSIPSLIEASESGEKRRLSKKELKQVADNIQKIFDANPDCLSYINDLLDNAAAFDNPKVSSNPLDVFWAVTQRGGIFTKNIKIFGGYALGSIGRVPQSIITERFGADVKRPREQAPAEIWVLPRRPTGNKFLFASAILAEVIHHSGAFTYTDYEMSQALALRHDIPLPNFSSKDTTKWSTWWHIKFGFIKKEKKAYCSIGKVENKYGP